MVDTEQQYGVVGASTPDERSMAVLAHVLQLVGGWIAPLVIFFIKRQSRFVSFHALQVLLLEGVWLFLTISIMAAIFIAMALGIILGGTSSQHGPPPLIFFLGFGTFWLGLAASWVVKVVLAIVYGIKASRGEWAEYPVLGRLARYILHIGPGGAVANE